MAFKVRHYFFWLFCTWYNFRNHYGGLGTGNGNVSSIHASSSFAIISIRISRVGSISSISGISRVGSMGIGISTIPVGGSNDSGCYWSNSWGSNNGSNFMNRGNREANFSSSIFVEDSLECSLSLSNISVICQVSRGSSKFSLCSLNFISVFDRNCGSNSQNSSENESL